MDEDNRAAAEELQRSMMLHVTDPPPLQAPTSPSQERQERIQPVSRPDKAINGAYIVRLSPDSIAPSLYANRLPFNWESAAFQKLKAEIQVTKGNTTAIKVRKVEGSATYEIVYGHRRHRACFELGLEVLAIVEKLNDVDLFIQMTKENTAREDVSSYERGMQFSRLKEDGVFSSNQQLGAVVDLDQSEVARLIRLAALPVQIVNAFRSPADINVKWTDAIAKALKDDEEGALNRAASISAAGGSAKAKDVFDAICNLPRNPAPAGREREIKIKQDGKLWASIFLPPAAHGAGSRIQFVQGAVETAALVAAMRALANR